MKDNTEYYEKFDWQKANLNERLQDKIVKIIATIPKDVTTIMDIGCGDGTISNALGEKYKVIAVDRSQNALSFVKTEKICASASSIPVESNSIDLVFSSEMIEHLPDNIFNDFVKESKRISKKYIFLTFPNNENIKKLMTKCPKCESKFNKSYHLRELNKKKILNYFAEYELINSFTLANKIRHYNRFLSKLKQKFTPAESWIPKLWTKNNGRTTMCPVCNYRFEMPFKNDYLARLIDLINIIISRKRPYQIAVLLQRKEND